MRREDERFDVVVVGAGQAGLATGYFLQRQRVRFVLLDAAPRIGHAWRTRWDSLALFTPARYSNLPGKPLPLPPGAYPTKDDIADYLERYAETFRLPAVLGCRVELLSRTEWGYRLVAGSRSYEARTVVVATGPFQRAAVPSFAGDLAPEVFQVHSREYVRPERLPDGPVLVVGSGNSGRQIAAEVARRRPVSISAGRWRPYLPQRVLGRDVFWWLTKTPLLTVPVSRPLDKALRRREPMIGTSLRTLRRQGVRVLPRAVAADGRTVQVRDGRTIQVASVVWATGFRHDFGWIDVPVFDGHGDPVLQQDLSAAPGLYFVGLNYLRSAGSALLGWVGRDAELIAARIAG